MEEQSRRSHLIWSIGELTRLARFDRRAGIEYWLDSELAVAMRDLVRDAIAAPESRASSRASATPPRPGSTPRSKARSTAPDSQPPTGAPSRPVPPTDEASQPAPPSGEASRSASPSEVSWNLDGPKAKAPARPRAASREKREWGPPPAAEGRDPDWEAQLEAVAKEASVCRACGLCESRKNVVFGVGSAQVPLVFIGEAPGAEEDRQGIPFVGRAGQLLTKIIAAIGLRREDVYICNVLKCRPPENRNPAPDEIGSCTPYLDRQLALLRPKVICTLGLFASQYLLDSTQSMGRLRGRIHDYKGIPVLPTYHPAALLRNPAFKATVWEDVQLLRETLDA